jgi:hypothetical protein
VVQGDGDHDFCTAGSYAKTTLVLTSTQTSRPSKGQRTHAADSRVKYKATVLVTTTQTVDVPTRWFW